ncbi:MAG: acetyl-CoA carboxylase carboxyltransferase subunit alpha [Holosporales bacterium]|jgi:acetyl-CoA carboxylase carboxyl transferase subunit alpha|nr:acetyl-CoA carboxylase carboxyltransferase subunit alpha [Holosporales bacterium]
MSFPLEFENQVLSIEKKIKELRDASKLGDIDVASEISKMQAKVNKLLVSTYRKLTPWQKVQVARHPDRPKFLDYLSGIFTDYVELSGDRICSDDKAIIGGFAKMDDIKCIVIGEEKGRDTESRLAHNFGMAKPEGYRKAHRLLDLAHRFGLPVISFIDTSGAFPGIESEERGQAEAIARCMEKSFQIDSAFISVVIGEGGSGGAIAISTSDYILMLEHAVYSVISPEGCASILWKDDLKAEIAAEAQKLTAPDLLTLGIIDKIIDEPTGGAHRGKDEIIANVKIEIIHYLNKSLELPADLRKDLRRQKFMAIGNNFLS